MQQKHKQPIRHSQKDFESPHGLQRINMSRIARTRGKPTPNTRIIFKSMIRMLKS